MAPAFGSLRADVADGLARHDRKNERRLADERSHARACGIERLRLDGEHQHVRRRQRGRRRIEPDAGAGTEGGEFGRRIGIEHGDAAAFEPECEPALQHRAAHLAGADQHERSGQRRHVQASPAVSNKAESSASRALLPAHRTNWNA